MINSVQASPVTGHYGKTNSRPQKPAFGRILDAYCIKGGSAEGRVLMKNALMKENGITGLFKSFVSECGQKIGIVRATDKKDFSGLTYRAVEIMADSQGARAVKRQKRPAA